VGHVARIGEIGNEYNILMGKLEGKISLGIKVKEKLSLCF